MATAVETTSVDSTSIGATERLAALGVPQLPPPASHRWKTSLLLERTPQIVTALVAALRTGKLNPADTAKISQAVDKLTANDNTGSAEFANSNSGDNSSTTDTDDNTVVEQNENAAEKAGDNDEERDTSISFDVVSTASRALLEACDESERRSSPFWLHKLLKGSSIHFTPPNPRPAPKRSKELDAHLQRIRNHLDQQEYDRMVEGWSPSVTDDIPKLAKGIDAKSLRNRSKSHSKSQTTATISTGNSRQTGKGVGDGTNRTITGLSMKEYTREMREAFQHVTVVFNILFSMVAVFAFFYYISPSLIPDFAFRILWSGFAAIVVGVAEAWLYLSKLLAVSQPASNNDSDDDPRTTSKAAAASSSHSKQD
ncbi:hypothetical protein GQ42DRAFT_164535 [Ramicandelaber brevisporus]|nr:hypothetical protein GQ42DRAFT_164535 [Ramicandelaber brevisporus]